MIFLTQDQTRVSCISGWILYHCSTWEAPLQGTLDQSQEPWCCLCEDLEGAHQLWGLVLALLCSPTLLPAQ